MIANIIIIAYVLLIIIGLFTVPYEIGKPRKPVTTGSTISGILINILFLIAPLYFIWYNWGTV